MNLCGLSALIVVMSSLAPAGSLQRQIGSLRKSLNQCEAQRHKTSTEKSGPSWNQARETGQLADIVNICRDHSDDLELNDPYYMSVVPVLLFCMQLCIRCSSS